MMYETDNEPKGNYFIAWYLLFSAALIIGYAFYQIIKIIF